MQHVRRAALDQGGPLLDPEAVLLVDDGDGEVGELDLLLDERVRAHRELRLAARERGARGRVLLRPQRARQQHDADAELGAEALDREEVLLRERLRRRHQRPLAAVLDRAEEGVERDDGLPRADVALQQPLHRHGAREIAVDLADDRLLLGRECEGQRLAVAPDQLARLAERRRDRGLALAGATGDRELEHEQLVEGEAPAPRLGLVEVARPVERDHGVAAQRQALVLAERGRERVRERVDVRERRLDEPSQPLRGHVLRGRVDRRVVGRGAGVADVVGLHREAAAARERAAQAHLRPGRQAVGDPGLVEPDRVDLATVVTDADVLDGQAPRRPPARGAHHGAGDRDLLLAEQVADRALRRRLLVAVRPVQQQVADRAQAEAREAPRERLSDPGQRLRRPARAGPAAARSSSAATPRAGPRSRTLSDRASLSP